MKRITLIALTALLFLAANVAEAQIRAGAKAGVNFARVNVDDDNLNDETESVPGLLIGGFINFNIAPVISIQPEVNFSQKGYKMDYEADVMGSTVTTSTTATLNYLEIPVNVKVGLGPLYAMAGPYFGYALSGEVTTKVDDTENTDDIDFEESETSRTDFGLNVAAGYKKGIGPVNVFGEVRYGMGFTDLDETDNSEMKNSHLGVYVGVILGF